MKAIALLLYLKKKVWKSSSISRSSYNRIAKFASVSPNTIKKYMPVWIRLGLIEWQGRNKDVFVIRKFSARREHRNYDISRLDFSSFKNTYYSLRSMLFLIMQSQKEYVKRMVRSTYKPKKLLEYKAARRFCNRHAHTDENGKFVFIENGISYKKIGKVIGFCERTAERIVQFALKKKWCKKETHYNYTYMPGVCFREVEGYTFTTWNYAYIVGANTYTLSDSMNGSLLDGKM